MKASSVLGLGALLLSAACNVSLGGTAPDSASDAGDDTVDESAVAGANENDRSLGRDGEDLQTGAMVSSPDGRFLVLQRNTVTLVYEVATATYRELPAQLDRVAFAKSSATIFAHFASGSLQAIDLSSLAVRWNISAATSTSMLRVSDDDSALLVGEPSALRVIDVANGAVRNTAAANGALYAAFVPGQARALVVAPTVWHDGGPHTPVLDVDLNGGPARASIDIPNCAAPIVVTPNAARAFMSPTYCSPGAQAVPGEVWTNPDPVSVIDLVAASATFDKNLPGFGPVALSKDGARLIAYLDVKRMDATMFDDPSQVPWKDGPRYQLMTIDPATLTFQLTPVGNAIPRFALTNDGRGLLVDASQKFTSRVTIAARASISVDQDGVTASADTNLDIFGSSSAFGYFDLASQTYTAFSGPNAPLDRFVQYSDGRFVLTLGKRADGLGGTPFLIDLQTKTTSQLSGNYGSGVRDVGLAADGQTVSLRLRLPADIHDGGYYSREGLCTSVTGDCGVSLTASYEASIPFALVPPAPPPSNPLDETCPGTTHDCL